MSFVRSVNSKYKFGAHVSAAGGISNSIINANKLGCNSFAMFLKSPRQWNSKPIPQDEIEKFHELCKSLNYNPMTDILPHGSYFINLANPDQEKAEKAYDAFLDDLKRCELLGIGLYNFHPGSSLKGNHELQLKQLAKYINKAIQETKFVKLVLENMAGHGNLIGSDLQDLHKIIEMIDIKERVGVCIDTCHTFAAGYDITTKDAFDKFWKTFEDIIGMKYLSAIHLNDSKAPLGANADRHELLGEGFLGLDVFKIISHAEFLKGLPIILETPQKDDSGYGKEIKLLEWLESLPEGIKDDEYIKRSLELQEQGSKSRKDFSSKFEKKKGKSSTTSRKRSSGDDILSKLSKKSKKDDK